MGGGYGVGGGCDIAVLAMPLGNSFRLGRRRETEEIARTQRQIDARTRFSPSAAARKASVLEL